MHFSPFFSDKAVKIKPESFFWWKIVLICHIACPKWIKIVDFRGFLHFRAENPGFRVKILKLQFLQKGSMKNFKNCTKQTPTLYIFMGGMSCLCSWKKLISPKKPTVSGWPFKTKTYIAHIVYQPFSRVSPPSFTLYGGMILMSKDLIIQWG